MHAIFGSGFLPVISATDSVLIKRLFEASHVQFSLEHEDRINQIHLTLNQTIGRAKYGTWGFDCSNLRKIFKLFIARCPTCLKSDTRGKDGHFTILLGSPRLASLLGEESPCFHTVSLDIQGPFIVSNFQGAKKTRGKYGCHKLYGLIIVDLLTSCFHIEFLNNASSLEVEAALKSFSSIQRIPRKAITDAGSSLMALEKSPLFTGLKRMGVEVEAVAAGHQMLNFSERIWQDVKRLLSSMRRNVNRSIYDQVSK